MSPQPVYPSQPCTPSPVFALWRVPSLLPSFLLTGGEISRYLLLGADLMASGVQVGITMLGSEEAIRQA
ncbi:unnamed protein product [Closterium sp. NIES-54]